MRLLCCAFLPSAEEGEPWTQCAADASAVLAHAAEGECRDGHGYVEPLTLHAYCRRHADGRVGVREVHGRTLAGLANELSVEVVCAAALAPDEDAILYPEVPA